MLPKYEQVCYELLRPCQIKERMNLCPVIYIVAGSLEWHSFQNPLGTDSLKAHAICCEAALKHGGVVLPPFYQGLVGDKNWGPDGWEGYTLGFNNDDMFKKAMIGTCRALVYSGWKVLVGVTGHDVELQRSLMEEAIDVVTDDQSSTGFAIKEGEFHKPSSNIPFSMDHAGAWETSCMMYTYPDKVNLNSLEEHKLSNGDDLKMSGPEGIGGKNPLKYASKEMGKKIIKKMGDKIGKKAIKKLDKLNSKG